MRFTQIANACWEIKATFVLKCSNGDSAHLSALFFVLKKAYEKRMRGEQEEEESEDEISSHKTVVTKFLNKVQFQLAFYRKGSIFLRPTLFTI